MSLEQRCINTIRMLSLDMIQKANSGHPGMPLGAAPMAYVLWTRFLKHNPKNPTWPNRDRFILSAGHGSALLYSLLYLTGYDLSIEELKRFRQWGSKTPGHPEYRLTPGVECTTGPLGQGFATAVGMAIAERHLASIFNMPDFEIVNHYTYIIASDGDLMEGVSSEAASLAGHLGLGKIICLYDSNDITLAAETSLSFTENVNKRFNAFGWHTQIVKDGNNIDEIEKAIRDAIYESDRPSLIIVKTHIGFGSPKQDTIHIHGSPLSKEDLIKTKENFGWPLEPDFYVPHDVLSYFRLAVAKGQYAELEWNSLFLFYTKKYPEKAKQWNLMLNRQLPDGWAKDIPNYVDKNKKIATRVAGGEIINSIAKNLPNLIGGSGDLDPSTKTALIGMGNFQKPAKIEKYPQGAVSGPWGYEGRNIAFGVREHAMAAILNGIAYYGFLIPFGSTFLVFSDYMRPSIRLAALSKLHVIYIFTHDSVAVGEDGPTHQPVEQIANLRAIPNLVVIRPADANETVEAWKIALNLKNRPVAIILSRQDLPVIDKSSYSDSSNLKKGAYILAGFEENPDLIIIATGSEVHLAIEVYEFLKRESILTRVVSMPSWELFEEQPEEYKKSIIPDSIPKISIEAGVSMGWHKYVGAENNIFSINHFGASAPSKVILENFGFTKERIIQKIKEIINK
jgi:transketolase